MKRVLTVLVVLLLALFLAACGDGEGPTRDDEGAIVEEGQVSVLDLEVGDCFNDPENSAAGLVSDLAAVPCDQPHDNEVFHVVDYPAEGNLPFPGEELDTFADEQCLQAFEGYVGRPYLESAYVLAPIKPTQDSWAQGDREVVCILFDESLNKLEGSKRGSNE